LKPFSMEVNIVLGYTVKVYSTGLVVGCTYPTAFICSVAVAFSYFIKPRSSSKYLQGYMYAIS